MTVFLESKIKISSIIENLDPSGLVEGEAEKNESEYDGYFKYSDGEVAITYSESGESGEVSSEITYADGVAVVKRHGAIESELRFELGVPHSSVYSIPPYKFDATVTTRKIRAELDERGGRLELYYNMKIGGAEKSARMKIWILTNSSQS